jgi:alpha-amylase/alpha-mannosidase (GH57 family)
MSKIYLCFLWHMHQPFYKDLVSGEYRLPWARMHGLKDYYGMARTLEEFPQVRQTFNLVPSLVAQVEEYASGQAADPFLRLALKPSESLTDDERSFILNYFFQANPARMIYRYPRYGELYDGWLAANRSPKRAMRHFTAEAFRDLQVLSQLAWFDEEFQSGDPEVRELIEKGREYSPADQSLVGRKQAEILAAVIPQYQKLAASGQIEISTTPYYHPILPLVCDSEIAGVSHPYVPLPSRFRYPEDARLQLARSREFIGQRFGRAPQGLWPSEGSVSDEVLAIAAETGFQWAATDNGVLARTLGHDPGAHGTYRPYVWRPQGREMRMIFRDHFLSDLVGFVYSRMGAAEAAADFLNRIRENCREFQHAGRDALVPIILDGENAWEYYEGNGRPFLRELYRRISDDPRIEAVTIGEALRLVEPSPLDGIFPGSWIGANFDVWIGAEEDNQAWEHLLRARQTFERTISGPDRSALAEERRRLAEEELLIAEGSDWCWWYGPEHDSANRPDFDKLYRAHLANVYRALGKIPPDELSRPILKVTAAEFHVPAAGPIRATIDGEVTSFFEWLGAGTYRVDARHGAMHGHRYLIRELLYGSDGQSVYLRIDFEAGTERLLAGMHARLNFAVKPDAQPSVAHLRFEPGRVVPEELRLVSAPQSGQAAAEFTLHRILEMRLSLAALGVAPGQPVYFQLSIWQDGLPMDALPQQGWLQCPTAEPSDWPV